MNSNPFDLPKNKPPLKKTVYTVTPTGIVKTTEIDKKIKENIENNSSSSSLEIDSRTNLSTSGSRRPNSGLLPSLPKEIKEERFQSINDEYILNILGILQKNEFNTVKTQGIRDYILNNELQDLTQYELQSVKLNLSKHINKILKNLKENNKIVQPDPSKDYYRLASNITQKNLSQKTSFTLPNILKRKKSDLKENQKSSSTKSTTQPFKKPRPSLSNSTHAEEQLASDKNNEFLYTNVFDGNIDHIENNYYQSLQYYIDTYTKRYKQYAELSSRIYNKISNIPFGHQTVFVSTYQAAQAKAISADPENSISENDENKNKIYHAMIRKFDEAIEQLTNLNNQISACFPSISSLHQTLPFFPLQNGDSLDLRNLNYAEVDNESLQEFSIEENTEQKSAELSAENAEKEAEQNIEQNIITGFFNPNY